VTLTTTGGETVWSICQIALDAQGRFTVESALPGRYCLSLFDAETRGNRAAEEMLELTPGGDVERAFRVR
jgi:hypothetical protein